MIHRLTIQYSMLYMDVPSLRTKMKNRKLFKPKTESVKKKYINSLKKSRSVRQNTGSSNSAKIELINSVENNTPNTNPVVNEKNTDFSYKKKFEKEIDRCRRLKYEARYANFDIETKNQTIDIQAKQKPISQKLMRRYLQKNK